MVLSCESGVWDVDERAGLVIRRGGLVRCGTWSGEKMVGLELLVWVWAGMEVSLRSFGCWKCVLACWMVGGRRVLGSGEGTLAGFGGQILDGYASPTSGHWSSRFELVRCVSGAGVTFASERDLSECSKLWLVCSWHLPFARLRWAVLAVLGLCLRMVEVSVEDGAALLGLWCWIWGLRAAEAIGRPRGWTTAEQGSIAPSPDPAKGRGRRACFFL